MDQFLDTVLEQVSELEKSQNSTNEIMQTLNKMMSNINADLNEQQFHSIVQKLLELQKSQDEAIQTMETLNHNVANAETIIAVSDGVFKNQQA